jgi:hypothetical protein
MLFLGSLFWGLTLIMGIKFSFKRSKIQSVSDLRTFQSMISEKKQVGRIEVTCNPPNITQDHPVVKAVLARLEQDSKPGKRSLGTVC